MSEAKTKLAVVETLYESNCRDIAATLRRNADAIENGLYGDVERLVFVMMHTPEGVGDQKIEVFGMGAGSSFWSDLGILHGGIDHLTKMIKP